MTKPMPFQSSSSGTKHKASSRSSEISSRSASSASMFRPISYWRASSVSALTRGSSSAMTRSRWARA
ncbi:Uncharacterised protein [Bordetella pertussis]|nr:Uncharacterised protein [Bordetella pertussis]